jgi:hypothetical protein
LAWPFRLAGEPAPPDLGFLVPLAPLAEERARPFAWLWVSSMGRPLIPTDKLLTG